MLSIFSQFIFGNSGRFGGQHAGSKQSAGKDRNLYFDLRRSELELDSGEQLIASFFPIEDVKGNQDDLGLLKVTNLRLIWISCVKKRVNFSIGLQTVSLVFEQNLKDSLGGGLTSLCVLTNYKATKYEFVFNKMPAHHEIWNYQDNIDSSSKLESLLRTDRSLMTTHLSPMYLDDPFEVVFKVWKAHKQTALFRQCRANLADLVIEDLSSKSPISFSDYSKLPAEETIDIYTDVFQSESRSIKYLGVLILTNVRIIWIDSSIPLRNLSIPYTQIESIRIKSPEKLIIYTESYMATSNQTELRISRSAEHKPMFEQVQKLHALYRANPRFGPESCDDCIEFMSHLRSLDHYFDGKNNAIPENLGPALNSQNPVVKINYKQAGDRLWDSMKRVDADEFLRERDEIELDRYGTQLKTYLDEVPVISDKEVIYSEELGLAVERPKNDANLSRIWKIDL